MIEQGLLARQGASIKKSTAESCYSFVNNKSSFVFENYRKKAGE